MIATDGFKNFLREYIDLNTNLPYYPPLFRDLINHQKNVLNVNCRFIYDFNPEYALVLLLLFIEVYTNTWYDILVK